MALDKIVVSAFHKIQNCNWSRFEDGFGTTVVVPASLKALFVVVLPHCDI